MYFKISDGEVNSKNDLNSQSHFSRNEDRHKN